MKNKSLTVVSIAVAALSSAGTFAQEASYPMNGKYWVEPASQGIFCRSKGVSDPLGQVRVQMTVVSNKNGVCFFDYRGQVRTKFLVSEGYQYFFGGEMLRMGRTTLSKLKSGALVVDGGPRQPDNVGFGPIKCVYPKVWGSVQ